MSLCPVCNQLHTIPFYCPDCGNEAEDQGKLSDYYDDYSPYIDIDGLKLENGFPADHENHQCPHLYYCSTCRQELVNFISEWPQQLT
ncbi:hypothetical protein WD019_13985 [Fictibacillus sp. Mic-4]|uniref:hypothetical protein n=1 Tax=Fictibacillus TaxID=1329200 RepID=UPI00047CC8D5|nr:hypothetical protein [Fictibacillus gelatini]